MGRAESEGGTAVNHCMRHYEEPVMAYCRTCRNPFCNRCLVYSYGPTKPPYCVGCALFASGVRNGNNRTPAPAASIPEVGDVPAPGGPPAPLVMETSPTMDRRAERAYKRAEKTAQRQQAKLARKATKGSAQPMVEAAADDDEVQARTPAPSSVVPAPSSLLAGHDAL